MTLEKFLLKMLIKASVKMLIIIIMGEIYEEVLVSGNRCIADDFIYSM